MPDTPHRLSLDPAPQAAPLSARPAGRRLGRAIGRPTGPAALAAMLAFALVATALLPGCVSGRFRDTYPRPGESVVDSSPPYPDLIKGEVADVQVFRVKRKIRFTNTTADPIGPGRVWLNQRFSRLIGEIEPGETVEIRLVEFRDEYGEQFRAGGFFAFKDPDLVVLAEFEPEGDDPAREFTRLIVVENRLD